MKVPPIQPVPADATVEQLRRALVELVNANRVLRDDLAAIERRLKALEGG